MTELPPGPPPGLPQSAYTSWFTRVVAWVIDYLPYLVIVGIGYGIQDATQETACVADSSDYQLNEFCATGNSTLGTVAFSVSVLIGLAYMLWNYGYRQGTTGSSIGKSIMKFKVVSEKTGQPIGFGLSIVRQLAHIIDGIICYIGYLFPLWDAKRQTLADKIMTTVCLPL
ncbi:RDD family protein [Mycolicibacterium sp. CBM1]